MNTTNGTFQGVLWMLMVATLYGASAVLVKLLNQVFAYPMSVAIRALVAMIMLGFYLWLTNNLGNIKIVFSHFKHSHRFEKAALIWWVVTLGIGQMCFAYAVINGVNFSNPAMFYLNAAKVIISFFFGYWLLSEQKSQTQIAIVLFAIAGLTVYSLDDRSWLTSIFSLPTILALVAGTIEGISSVASGKLTNDPNSKYDKVTISFLKYTTALCIVFVLTIMLKLPQLTQGTLSIKELFLTIKPDDDVVFFNTTPSNWLIIGIVSLLIMGFNQSIISIVELLAYNKLDKAMGNVILQFELAFSALVVFFVFGSKPLTWQVIGILLLILPSIAAGINQYLKGKNKELSPALKAESLT